MKIRKSWPHLIGVHADQGNISTVALAHDLMTGVLWVCWTNTFKDQPYAVVAAGINQLFNTNWSNPQYKVYRPLIAWRKEDEPIIKQLKSDGCDVLKDGCDANGKLLEAMAMDIRERTQTGRFKLRGSHPDWESEYQAFTRDDASAGPLLSATCYAIDKLRKARPIEKLKTKITYSDQGIV